jgi:hypothetical protein
MTRSDLPQFRLLARHSEIDFSGHALKQMLNRKISVDLVEEILRSDSNQLIESQSPSSTPGKEHADERVLIFDPGSSSDVIVICALTLVPIPQITVVTAEHVRDKNWERVPGDPALIRKK